MKNKENRLVYYKSVFVYTMFLSICTTVNVDDVDEKS